MTSLRMFPGRSDSDNSYIPDTPHGGSNKDAKDDRGWTALIVAAADGFEDCVQLLLDGGADIEARNDRRVTALCRAATKGRTHCVQLLLDGGADQEAKDEQGSTALICAAAEGHTDCTRLLLAGGADKEAKDNHGSTALLRAAREGRADCLRLLIDCGADIEVRGNLGVTALFVAAGFGHADCVRLLVDGGANKEAKIIDGSAALIYAAGKGLTDCVRLLLDSGADKEAPAKGGCTPLISASGEGHTDCVRLLMDRGANKEATNDAEGLTALLTATVQGHAGCVQVLLDGGVNKEIKTKRGHTALEMALMKGHVDVARLIASFPGIGFHEMAQMGPKRRAKFMGRACYNCFKTQPDKMHLCSLCQVAKYCSKECQQSNWPRHKTTCDRGGALHIPASSQQCPDEVGTLASPSVQQRDEVRVNAPAPESSVEACHFCAKSQAHFASRLKLCIRCRSVRYCSVECQRGDWSAHKKECAKPGE
jgi:ankyrin repeat protein